MYHKIIFFSFFISLTLNLFALPLCIYEVSTPEDIKIIKKAGFNCFQAGNRNFSALEILAKTAKKQGLKAVFYPDGIIGEEEIKQANTWPVLAWYLYDEPDVHKVAPPKITEINAEVKSKLPNAPTAIVIGQGKTEFDYYNKADILMVDWYPVPHLALESFGQELALARAKLAPKTNFWGVVQAFNWKDFKQYRPDNDRIGRFPTEEEIYFMSWQSIANGANGLFYYTFNINGNRLNNYSTQVWQALKKTLKDIKKFSYFIEKGQEVKTPFNLPKELENRTWFYKNRYYTLIVNSSQEELSPILPNKAKDLLGKKRIPPYKVLIIKYK